MSAHIESPCSRARAEGLENHRRDDANGQNYKPAGSLIETLLSCFDGVRHIRGSHWLAHCPLCREERPALLITETDGQECVLFCFGGCPDDEILAAVHAHDTATMEALREVRP